MRASYQPLLEGSSRAAVRYFLFTVYLVPHQLTSLLCYCFCYTLKCLILTFNVFLYYFYMKYTRRSTLLFLNNFTSDVVYLLGFRENQGAIDVLGVMSCLRHHQDPPPTHVVMVDTKHLLLLPSHYHFNKFSVTG